MLVTGGLRYEHQWYFGGRVNGNPPTGGTGDSLYRFGRATKSIWDPPIKPVAADTGDRPSPREGHTAVHFQRSSSVLDPYQAFFGGKNGNATTTDNAVYLLKREDGGALDADYKYSWSKLGVSGPLLPLARSDHVAIDLGGTPSEMAIYGGLSQPSGGPATVLPDFWKLSFNTFSQQWVWSTLPTSGGPGARYGHAAAFNNDSINGKIYLFGGSGAADPYPTDNRVWVFSFASGFASGTWDTLATTGTPPEPRRDHTMVLAGTSLLIYGGYLGTSPSSSALWRLDLPASPTSAAVWNVIPTDGPSPGRRANHSAFYDVSVGARLTLFGGDPPTASDPPVDSLIYSINPFSTGNATWVQGPVDPNRPRLSGHTVTSDPQLTTLHARIPEIYNPSSNAWTPQTGSGWLPRYEVRADYPVQFLVPGTSIPGGGGRVLRVGRDPITRYLDIPATGLAGPWQTVLNGDNGDFLPLTGVQYEPGKILVIGGEPGVGGVEDNRARTFNAMAIGTVPAPTWVDPPGMAARTNANILVLPNGNVLVLGETLCPQIWDPSASGCPLKCPWTAYSPCGLAPEPVNRGYHSTAMLLPDARVLTAGGRAEKELRVFCPPYLFNGDSLAPRPTITSAPASMVYGQTFVIGKLATDYIASACLIRPAAVTHSFDQNGRFVPLVFTTQPGDTALFTFAPTSGSIAPPGYYLLFILNTNGVPAIARWVRLGNCATVPYDTAPPPSVVDLYADIVGPNEIWLAWSAPGDDLNPGLGSYDLRISTAPILTEIAFAAASPVVPPDYPPPSPGPIGSGQSSAKFSLAACTPYYFAIKAKDGCNNWMGMGTLAAGTGCGWGGGGGGFSAHRVDEHGEGAGATAGIAASPAAVDAGAGTMSPVSPANASDAPMAGATAVGAAAGVLVAETRRAPGGAWQVTLRLVTEAEGLDAGEAAVIVSQVRDARGAWKTLGRYRPTPGQSPLGLCALRDQGRVVFPVGYGLDRVVTGLRAGSQDLALSLADHSRLGPLGERVISSGGGVELALGDALTLTYTPSGDPLPGAAGWFVLVRPTGIVGPSATPVRRELVSAIPTRFALHQNQPNPFHHTTTIAFDLPVASPVTLEVFDLLGRKVVTLAQGEHPAGAHRVEWDVRDVNGAPVRPGVYVCRLVAGSFRAQTKIGVLP